MTTTETRKAGSAARILARRLGDRALSRYWRLPPPNDYTVNRAVRIPMRDGVQLLADHYIPGGERVKGAVLVRGPYGRGFPFATCYARLYAANGYHVILQSTRGTFGSGGVFEPMVNEVDDGADTVGWLRKQPWFTGRFATMGLSYLGFTQWALLVDPPPELATAIVTVGPHDFADRMWGTGSFTLDDFLGWCHLVAHQEDGSMLRRALAEGSTRRRLARAANGLPLGEAGRALLGAGAPWYESWLEHPDPADPFWQRYRLGAALDRLEVPVLLIGGWQDLFINQTVAQYEHLRGRGSDVAMTIGPWTHRQMVGKAGGTVIQESLDWLNTHLAGADSGRVAPVRVFVTGQEWQTLSSWPPPTTDQVLHLGPGGGLAAASPPTAAAPSTFRYDPTDPTPTVGGRLLAAQGGYRDDTTLGHRADVLSFTTEPLAEDLCVFGRPVVELCHGSDNPNVDLFVRVSEVDAQGRSRNVSDGYLRLIAPQDPQVVRIELDTIAHRFAAGSRIRLLVAGGSHPRFARNTGTGEPPVTARRLVPANHVVHHGQGGISRLVLPASVPGTDGRQASDPSSRT